MIIYTTLVLRSSPNGNQLPKLEKLILPEQISNMPMAQLQQEHLHMNFHEKVNEYMNRAVNKKASDYI